MLYDNNLFWISAKTNKDDLIGFNHDCTLCALSGWHT